MPPTVHIYESELLRMAAHMAAFPRRETGGELFGLATHSGASVVYRVTGPAKRARHLSTSFFQDEAFIRSASEVAWAHGLQHLGSWHSHHHIGLAEPSGGDEHTARAALKETGWPRFLMIIGNFPDAGEDHVTLGFTQFDAASGVGSGAAVRTLDGQGPFRHLKFEDERQPGRVPAWVLPREPRELASPWHKQPHMVRRIVSEAHALFGLARAGIEAAIFLDGDEFAVRATASNTRSSDARCAELRFGAGFPDVPPEVVNPRVLHLPTWSVDRTLANVVEELLTQPVCAPRAENRFEPAEPAALLSAGWKRRPAQTATPSPTRLSA
ncbi:hypothetical protein LBMAG42_56830 [Deltaproteobacteria bacterium]|nr:hypothetical protein LBMAG42_56830 [Deltaproteobacteria bacterium]